MGRGLKACLGDFAPGLGVGVLGDDVEVVVDEVVVVVEVVESEAEETDVGDGGRSQPESEVEVTDVADTRASLTVGAGAGCWVVWAMRTKVRVWASGVCARLQWCSLCVPGLVLWVVSCVVLGGVVELSWLRRQVGYPWGGPLQLQEVWVCLLEGFEGPEEALPGMSSSVEWG